MDRSRERFGRKKTEKKKGVERDINKIGITNKRQGTFVIDTRNLQFRIPLALY